MTNGKVLALYMTLPDLMRSGHRMQCDDFECDPGGIIGDVSHETEFGHRLLLVSEKSYDLIEQAELAVDKGVLLENIYVDVDINQLKEGSVIEIGSMLFEVLGPCEAYRYLYALSPELPEIIHGNRGIFITPMEYGKVEVGDEIKVVQEA